MSIIPLNIFLFYPNLIGYARIMLALIAFHGMISNPIRSSICYFLSALLDAFDGYLARRFRQDTYFGAILDQLADRCGFMGLLMTLCHFYPDKMFGFQFIAILDIASHWLHLHARDLVGKNTHKASANSLLNYYYTSRPFLFTMCFGNETFFGLLYVHTFWPGPTIGGELTLTLLLAYLFSPIALLKFLINLLHLVIASLQIVKVDDLKRKKILKKWTYLTKITRKNERHSWYLMA